MKITRILNPIARENTYILETEEGLLVIDPGSDKDSILEELRKTNKPLVAILLTHTHYDHIMSVDHLRDAFPEALVYVSEKEAAWLGSPKDNLSGLSRHSDIEDVIVRPADKLFQEHQTYDLAGTAFIVLPTPGHSQGGLSFVFPDAESVFSGDALFRETIGRTDLPTSNLEALLDGIKTELFTLPNHYKVYPGHGWETTIGHEKTFNPFFQT